MIGGEGDAHRRSRIRRGSAEFAGGGLGIPIGRGRGRRSAPEQGHVGHLERRPPSDRRHRTDPRDRLGVARWRVATGTRRPWRARRARPAAEVDERRDRRRARSARRPSRRPARRIIGSGRNPGSLGDRGRGHDDRSPESRRLSMAVAPPSWARRRHDVAVRKARSRTRSRRSSARGGDLVRRETSIDPRSSMGVHARRRTISRWKVWRRRAIANSTTELARARRPGSSRSQRVTRDRSPRAPGDLACPRSPRRATARSAVVDGHARV